MAIDKIITKSLALSSVNSDIILNNSIDYVDLKQEISDNIKSTSSLVQSNSSLWVALSGLILPEEKLIVDGGSY
jgi:hypothetical protein